MHDEISKNTLPGKACTIYADGLGIQRKFVAATFEPATNTATQQYLGSETHFMFAAEVGALATAAEIILRQTPPKQKNTHHFHGQSGCSKGGG